MTLLEYLFWFCAVVAIFPYTILPIVRICLAGAFIGWFVLPIERNRAGIP